MRTNDSGRANRVAPDGSLHASAARGLFWGNRGQLLDARGQLAREWQNRAWITCLLEFKGWHRTQWQPKRLTELYFLDEATALAAGHRPCGECRLDDYRRFKAAWMRAQALTSVRAPDIDIQLHAERMDSHGRHRSHRAVLADLPDATMIEHDGEWWLLRPAGLSRWSWDGYGEPLPRSHFPDQVTVCTPPATVAALRAGYVVRPASG